MDHKRTTQRRFMDFPYYRYDLSLYPIIISPKLFPQSPENDIHYNPWDTSLLDPSSSDDSGPIESAEASDASISPGPNQNILHPPDLTGKITKESDYPVSGGSFADVFRGVLHVPQGECKVRGVYLWNMR
jgi:hypothetical protein